MRKFQIISLLSAAVFLFACEKVKDDADDKKEQLEVAEEMQKTSQDNSNAESVFDEILSDVSRAGETATLKTGNEFLDIVSIELLNSPELFPRKITINYGEGYTTLKQVVKKGKVIATFTGKYRDEGTVITVELDGYSRNDVAVTGTKTVTNLGTVDGKQKFSVSVKDATLTDEDGTRTWSSERERVWIEGDETLIDWTDDKYSITGTYEGTNVNGTPYSIEVTNALIYSLECYQVVEGTLDYTITLDSKEHTATVDYGSGSCDGLATVSIYGQSLPIVQY